MYMPRSMSIKVCNLIIYKSMHAHVWFSWADTHMASSVNYMYT